jgi:hypothetical protein
MLFAPFEPYASRRLSPEAFPAMIEARTELSIEFFTFFECFTDLPVITPFADPMEIPYFLRAILESDAIADSLHIWVAQMFRCGVPRDPPRAGVSAAFSVNLPDFRLATYSSSAFRLVQGEDVLLSVAHGEEMRCWRLSLAIGDLFAHEAVVAVVGRDRRKLVCSLNNGESFRDITLDFQAERIVHCEDLIAASTRSAEIAVLRVPTLITRFSVKTEKAMSLWASSAYNRVVVGTRSGRLCFYALYDGRFVTAVDLGGFIPLRILVTAGFGFVVVAFHRRLAVFTINGTKIREREFAHNVTEWCPMVNRRGFDFVLVATTEGRVIVVEAFTLKEGPTLFQSEAIAVLKYDNARRAFAVATPDGCGHIVLCEPVESTPSFD